MVQQQRGEFVIMVHGRSGQPDSIDAADRHVLEVLLQVRARQQSEPEPTPVRPIRVPTREQAGE